MWNLTMQNSKSKDQSFKINFCIQMLDWTDEPRESLCCLIRGIFFSGPMINVSFSLELS